MYLFCYLFFCFWEMFWLGIIYFTKPYHPRYNVITVTIFFPFFVRYKMTTYGYDFSFLSCLFFFSPVQQHNLTEFNLTLCVLVALEDLVGVAHWRKMETKSEGNSKVLDSVRRLFLDLSDQHESVKIIPFRSAAVSL